MPIIVDRHTGKVISKPEINQQQSDLLLEAIVRNWLGRNPEKFQALLTKEKDMESP